MEAIRTSLFTVTALKPVMTPTSINKRNVNRSNYSKQILTAKPTPRMSMSIQGENISIASKKVE
jgi:hypothetical protein